MFFLSLHNQYQHWCNQYNARVAQLVERQPSKLNVAGSNPVSRSLFTYRRCSSGVERFLGKEEVTSSNLVIGSSEVHLTSIFSNTISTHYNCFRSPHNLIHYRLWRFRNTLTKSFNKSIYLKLFCFSSPMKVF